MKRETEKSQPLTLTEVEQQLFPKRSQHRVGLAPSTPDRGTGLACDFGQRARTSTNRRTRSKVTSR
jgi:hypothetical protein